MQVVGDLDVGQCLTHARAHVIVGADVGDEGSEAIPKCTSRTAASRAAAITPQIA